MKKVEFISYLFYSVISDQGAMWLQLDQYISGNRTIVERLAPFTLDGKRESGVYTTLTPEW